MRNRPVTPAVRERGQIVALEIGIERFEVGLEDGHAASTCGVAVITTSSHAYRARMTDGRRADRAHAQLLFGPAAVGGAAPHQQLEHVVGNRRAGQLAEPTGGRPSGHDGRHRETTAEQGGLRRGDRTGVRRR